MTTTVTIHTHENGQNKTTQVIVTDAALARARRSFNPSGNENVDALKVLAAAFYTLLDRLPDEKEAALVAEAGEGNSIPGGPLATVRREAATAATHIQAGAMFAVSAATA